MFGKIKSLASKLTSIFAKKDDKQPNQKKNDWEPGSEFSPAQASFLDSFKEVFIQMEEGILTWDPQKLSEEDMIATAQELMRFISTRIDTEGEASYIAKKVAIFQLEMLHGALRRGLNFSEVPPVHATLIDDMYSCIDAAKTGLYDEADVKVIDEEYNKDQKKILRKVQRKAGINIVLPT